MSNIVVFNNEYLSDNAIENVANYILEIGKNDFSNNYDFRYSGYGVNTRSVQSMLKSMMRIKERFHKNDGKQLHHFVITIYRNNKNIIKNNRKYAELIENDIGGYLMELGYQSICKTHINDNGIVHVHFMINSVNAFTGHKLTNTKSFYNQILHYLIHNYSSLNWQRNINLRRRN